MVNTTKAIIAPKLYNYTNGVHLIRQFEIYTGRMGALGWPSHQPLPRNIPIATITVCFGIESKSKIFIVFQLNFPKCVHFQDFSISLSVIVHTIKKKPHWGIQQFKDLLHTTMNTKLVLIIAFCFVQVST
jgi:hypothetical protein